MLARFDGTSRRCEPSSRAGPAPVPPGPPSDDKPAARNRRSRHRRTPRCEETTGRRACAVPYKAQMRNCGTCGARGHSDRGIRRGKGRNGSGRLLTPLVLPVQRDYLPAVVGEVLHPVVHQLTSPLEQVPTARRRPPSGCSPREPELCAGNGGRPADDTRRRRSAGREAARRRHPDGRRPHRRAETSQLAQPRPRPDLVEQLRTPRLPAHRQPARHRGDERRRAGCPEADLAREGTDGPARSPALSAVIERAIAVNLRSDNPCARVLPVLRKQTRSCGTCVRCRTGRGGGGRQLMGDWPKYFRTVHRRPATRKDATPVLHA